MNRAWFLMGALTLSGVAVAEHDEPDFTTAFRPILEAQLRENAGIGFTSFSCETEGPRGPEARIICSAIDEDGDHLRYTIATNDQGEVVVARTEQPASSLAAADLQRLQEPCRSFLAAYDQQRWSDLHAGLHPNLKSTISVEETRSMLSTIRTDLGDLENAEPTSFSVRFSGAQDLEYGLLGRNGEGLARFEIATDDDGAWRILSFIVTVRPGSPEQARMLKRAAREALSPLAGAPLVRVELPLGELRVKGDAVDGPAFLDTGREVMIRVEQHGNRDDYDLIDFRFYLLEVELMVEKALAKQQPDIRSVKCASRTVPDGGETPCTVTSADGSTLELVVRRQGGEHTMFRAGATNESTN